MTNSLILSTHLLESDRIHEASIEAHCYLSEVNSAVLKARPMLLLGNRVGHSEVLWQALDAEDHDARLV